MRLILASENGGIPLVLSGPESADGGTKLLDLASILRPIARSLRSDRAVVVRLSLPKKRARRT